MYIDYNNRANAKYDLGDKRGAIDDYTEAIKLKTDYASAYYNRGNTKANLGDKEGALIDLQKSAQLYQAQGDNQWYQNAIKAIDSIKRSI